MTFVLVFAVLLFSAMLVSALADRTILSTAVVFLIGGFVLGDGAIGVLHVGPGDTAVSQLAEFALFSILFTDGMRISIGELRQSWRLPGRALLLGLPLTLVATALLAHLLAGLPWIESFLLGAVLAPTDPVFAAAVVGREEIPFRLRNLLNVESGLNDGLALPIVVILIAASGSTQDSWWHLVADAVGGVLLGIVVPAIGAVLYRHPAFASSARYEPLNALAMGLIVLSIARLTGANEFLAAFSAGITVASSSPAVRDSFHELGEVISEVLKLAALLIFGALISVAFLRDISLGGYLFAAAAIFVARPVALEATLIGSALDHRERIVAAWFGPKGFASVVYGLLILSSGIVRSNELFHLVALVVSASIIAHSSTDVVIAHWFVRTDRALPVAVGHDDQGH